MKEKRTCPECGSQRNKTGEFKGYGSVFKKNSVLKSSPVDACFCLDCGTILFLRVRNIEKLT
ncbi:hypothetical protein AF332_26500 [Sporosarcina globispora]|uniref:Transcription initiation factor TFIIIB n=1 Tax=Sporosarcina globispora TaxID=1459 RepID=A0A0M0GJJ7_SPOGL|nr:hypothetical protein [Sporosarcina globispora]KON90014.1 hypothetical protein AF332_26500 [Sporosarcina globispora]